MFRGLVAFFIEGTRPIRAIEGIILVTLMLVFSYFPFFHGFNGIGILFSLFLAPISWLAFIHLRGCRGFYEMYLMELEVLENKSNGGHRSMITVIRIFEYYLLIYGILMLLTSALYYLNLFFLNISPMIVFTAVSYALISFTGHTARLSVIRRVKELKILKGNPGL